MSSSRASANQSLYLAKILLHSWQQAQSARDIPATTLSRAFMPATREHLLDAYGWFLLEVSGADLQPGHALPHSCRDLPAAAEGKAVAGEIREFAQLEAAGWLAQLLAPPVFQAADRPSPDNLATGINAGSDCAEIAQWVLKLESLLARMRDSLDEY